MERPQWTRFNGVDELSIVQEEPEENPVNGNDQQPQHQASFYYTFTVSKV